MNYSFITKQGFRIDATARTPKQAYKIANNTLDQHNKQRFGELLGTYFKYDKNGTHAVDGIYYQIKKDI